MGLITLLAAVGVVLSRMPDGGQMLQEGAALAAVFSVPGALVLMSLRNRPVLLLAGAVVSAALAPLLGVLMPLLAGPAVAYAIAYAGVSTLRSIAPVGAVVVAPLLLELGGAAAIVLSTETVCEQVGAATTCREVSTSAGSLAALSLAGTAAVMGSILATPASADRAVDTPRSTNPNT